MMQDAVVRVGEIKYESKSRKFAFISNRFAWESQEENERRRSGLHFENVLRAQRQGFAQSAADTVLSLLSIGFQETTSPSGMITLTFSAGHAIQLEVEYLDCSLRDLGPAWSTASKPHHPDE